MQNSQGGFYNTSTSDQLSAHHPMNTKSQNSNRSARRTSKTKTNIFKFTPGELSRMSRKLSELAEEVCDADDVFFDHSFTSTISPRP